MALFNGNNDFVVVLGGAGGGGETIEEYDGTVSIVTDGSNDGTNNDGTNSGSGVDDNTPNPDVSEDIM